MRQIAKPVEEAKKNNLKMHVRNFILKSQQTRVMLGAGAIRGKINQVR